MQLTGNHTRNFFQKYQNFFWLILVLISTLLVYSSSLHFGFTNWDDNYYVTQNPLIQKITIDHFWQWFSRPFLGLYQPLILISLALDYSLGDGQAWMFHLTNLLLHLANIVLVYSILKRLFVNLFIVLIVTSIFALHPLQVESVAWITERKNLLFALFFLGSMFVYLGYLENPSRKIYRLAVILFVAALLSKASAVVLPLVFMLLDYHKGRNPWHGKLLNQKIPLFIISFVLGVITLLFHYQYGSLVDSSGLSPVSRLLLASKSATTYLLNFLVPTSLSTYNPLPENMSIGLYVECVLYILLATGLFIYLKKRKAHRIIVWGIGFYLINIGLFLVPPGVPVLVSDRYMYLAILGPAVLLGFGLDVMMTKFRNMRKLLVVIPFAWFLFLIVQTFHQSQSWANSLNLWNRVLEVHGEQSFALIQRGSVFRTKGFPDKAMRDYSRSIELNPRFYRAFEYRGYMFALQKQYQKSISDFNAALKQFPKSDYANASLGYNYRKLGNYELALSYLNQALKLNPKNADALINRGKVYLKSGKFQDACQDFRFAKELLPANIEIDSLVMEYCNEPSD